MSEPVPIPEDINTRFLKLVNQCRDKTITNQAFYECLTKACEEDKEFEKNCFELLVQFQEKTTELLAKTATESDFCKYCKRKLLEEPYDIEEQCHISCKSEMEAYAPELTNPIMAYFNEHAYLRKVETTELEDLWKTVDFTPLYANFNTDEKLREAVHRAWEVQLIPPDIFLAIRDKLHAGIMNMHVYGFGTHESTWSVNTGGGFIEMKDAFSMVLSLTSLGEAGEWTYQVYVWKNGLNSGFWKFVRETYATKLRNGTKRILHTNIDLLMYSRIKTIKLEEVANYYAQKEYNDYKDLSIALIRAGAIEWAHKTGQLTRGYHNDFMHRFLSNEYYAKRISYEFISGFIDAMSKLELENEQTYEPVYLEAIFDRMDRSLWLGRPVTAEEKNNLLSYEKQYLLDSILTNSFAFLHEIIENAPYKFLVKEHGMSKEQYMNEYFLNYNWMKIAQLDLNVAMPATHSVLKHIFISNPATEMVSDYETFTSKETYSGHSPFGLWIYGFK